MSPMWLTSKMPTPVRTAMCSLIIPQPIEAGYSTGMSQPLNSTIFAPIWRWTAFSAVFRTAAAVASTADKLDLNQRGDGVTDYRNTRFFGGSNREGLVSQGAENAETRAPLSCPRYASVSFRFGFFVESSFAFPS